MQYSCFAVVLREREKGKEVLMVLNDPPDPMRKKDFERDIGKAFFIKDVGWGCPGGSAQVEETPFAAVKREVKEEASIDIAADQYTAQFKTVPQNNHAKVFFLIEDWEGEPRPDLYEVFDVVWIPLSLLLSDERQIFHKGVKIYNGHRFGIRELLRKLGKLPI
jgi:8-oxo-dGTP pyrophosphatase MutT (NUDIX family)